MAEEQTQTTVKGQTQEVVTPDVTISNPQNSMQIEVKGQVEEKPADPSTPQSTEQQQTQSQPPTENVQETITKSLQAESDLKADLSQKGVDFDALASEFDQTGELSETSRAALEKAGYPKSVVDAYLNGLEANSQKFVTAVQAFAGGAEAYQQLGQYIKSQGEGVTKAFNAAIQTGDLGQIQLAISGLKAQMVQQYGTNNPTIMAGANLGTTGAISGYMSTAEMVKDMSDPRYQVDAKFTKQVIQKVQYSKLF